MILRATRTKHAVSRRSQLAHLVFKDIQRQSPDRVDLLLKANHGIIRDIDPHNAILFVDMERQLVQYEAIYVGGTCLDVIHIQNDEVCVPDVEAFQIGQAVRQTVYTGAACDMFRVFEEEWKARWDRHKNVPVSQWEQICAFGKAHLSGPPCPMVDIDPDTLIAEISKKKLRSATGLDGVSLKDLKNGPRVSFHPFACCFVGLNMMAHGQSKW